MIGITTSGIKHDNDAGCHWYTMVVVVVTRDKHDDGSGIHETTMLVVAGE